MWTLPYEGLAKEDLPAQLCAFTHGVMQAWAGHRPGYYDLVHSHYWLSGHVGWLAAERWGAPLVHAMHTMAKVKNAALADGDTPNRPPGSSARRRSCAPPTASSPTPPKRPTSSYGTTRPSPARSRSSTRA